MIKTCMKKGKILVKLITTFKVIPVNIHQKIMVDEDFEIQAFYAGHVRYYEVRYINFRFWVLQCFTSE